ncbi:MAG: hypothetical protein AB7N71_05040 [Phycisphaerae bacterium]
MSPALLRRFGRDTLWIAIASVAAILVFEVFFIRAISEIDLSALKTLINIGFVNNVLSALLGTNVEGALSATTVATLGYVHPVLLVICTGYLTTECSRSLVGEIDRGSADVLLSLPISRLNIYVSVTAVWVLVASILCLMPGTGIWLATRFIQLYEPVDATRFFQLAPNFFLLLLAIGAITMLMSSFMIRRGFVIASVVAYIVASFLLNYLTTFWSDIEIVANLGLLQHYQPLVQMREGAFPQADMAVLVIIAMVAWTVGLFFYTRRDVPA